MTNPILASLESPRCPLCGSGKPHDQSVCGACLAAMPWDVRRGLCGPEAEYCAAMGKMLEARGIALSDGSEAR